METINYKQEAEKTMQLLDSLPKEKGSPYFASKLITKIENQQEHKFNLFDWNIALRYAFFVVIIVVNIAVSYKYLKSNNKNTDDRESMIEELSTTCFTRSNIMSNQ